MFKRGFLVEGSEDILFTLNKDAGTDAGTAFKKVSCLGGALSPENNPVAVNFFGGDDPCVGSAFFALEGEGSEFCVQVPNCEVVGADNCFESSEECEAASFEAPSFYCVTTGASTGVCCGSAVEGGWLCLTDVPPAFPNSFDSCMEQDHYAGRAAYFPGEDCSYCETIPVPYYLPPVGEQVSPDGEVSKVLVDEYDPSVHTILSGPVSASESCFTSSSSESSTQFVSSSSSSSVDSPEPSSSSVDGGDGGDGGSPDVGSSSSSVDGGDGGDGGSPDVSSSSSVEVVDDLSSSSSEYDSYENLPVYLNCTLNSNPDLPGLYYAEDVLNGLTVISDRFVEFRFESLGYGGFPLSSNIYIGSDGIATITYPPDYVGTDFCLIYNGVDYCGVVSEGDILF